MLDYLWNDGEDGAAAFSDFTPGSMDRWMNLEFDDGVSVRA